MHFSQAYGNRVNVELCLSQYQYSGSLNSQAGYTIFVFSPYAECIHTLYQSAGIHILILYRFNTTTSLNIWILLSLPAELQFADKTLDFIVYLFLSLII